MRDSACALAADVDRAVERFALDDALAAVFDRVDLANQLIDRTAPWALVRAGETARANTLLRALLETLRVIGCELGPFLPATAAELARALGPAALNAWNALTEGARLPVARALFPRIQVTPDGTPGTCQSFPEGPETGTSLADSGPHART